MISSSPRPLLIQLKIALTSVFIPFTVFLFAEKTFAQKPDTVIPATQKANEKSTDPEESDKLATQVLTHSSKRKEYRFTPAETRRIGDLHIEMAAGASTSDLQNAEKPDSSGNVNKHTLTSSGEQSGFSGITIPDFTKFGAPIIPKQSPSPSFSLYRFRIGSYLLSSDPDSLQKKSP